MRFRSLLAPVVGASLLLGAADRVLGADAPVLQRIVKSGELRVGMTGDQPPLNMKDKQGELMGLEVDLAKVLATAMGVKVKFVTKPFSELLPALGAGEVDLVMSGMTISLQRNLEAAFVGPYFISGKSILTRSKELAGADETADLDAADLTLAALETSTSQRFVEMLLPKAKLVTTENYDEAVKLVIAGEADAMVADMPACLVSMLRHPEAQLATLATPLTIEPIGIALPPGDPLLVNLVENYLNAISATGTLEMLQQRWTSDGRWLQQLP